VSSRVRLFSAGQGPVEVSHDEAEARLGELGVLWSTLPPRPLRFGADPDEVLAAWRDVVEDTRVEGAYQKVDVVSVHRPDEAQRALFREEHVHGDDETRLFTSGGGVFWIRGRGGEVWALATIAGDLLSLPAGLAHGFDMGPQPRFTAVRFFQDPAGWSPQTAPSNPSNRSDWPISWGLC
jgi:1,2-dihydroxy-3-keto-5-methylthiopentene dioxygenase